MQKILSLVVVLFALTITTVFASDTFHDTFNNNFGEEWFPVVFENMQPNYQLCGNSACGYLEKEGNTKFFRLELNSNAVFGVYSDMELREAHHDDPVDGGKWTPTFGHPVVLESRMRLGEGHNFDGSGEAVGTLGVGFWNNAEGVNAPSPEYDSITYSWIDDDFTDLFGVDGVTFSTAVNLFPVNRAYPQPFNVQEWHDVKFIWSEDASGNQSVEYFLNEISLGVHSIPTPLQGLSVVVWQDNQVFDDTFQIQYKVPTYTQHTDVDFVKVYQL